MVNVIIPTRKIVYVTKKATSFNMYDNEARWSFVKDERIFRKILEASQKRVMAAFERIPKPANMEMKVAKTSTMW